jgi:hypothetical protein
MATMTHTPSPRAADRDGLTRIDDHRPVAPVDHRAMAPLRSFLLCLVPPARTPGSSPVIHYVVEETEARAAEVSTQTYPGHRILSIRDVTEGATAA